MKRVVSGVLAVVLSLTLAGAAAAEPSVSARKAAREGLMQTPLYAAIERYYPAAFQKMIDKLATGLDAGLPLRDLVGTVRPLYLELVTEVQPRADAKSELGLMQLTRDQATEALAKEPRLCLGLLGFVEIPELPYEYLSPALQAREMEYMGGLLKQTAEHPAPKAKPYDEAEMELVARAAYDALPDNEARTIFVRIGGDASTARTPGEQRVACLYSIAMFDVLIARGEAGGEFWRGVSANP